MCNSWDEKEDSSRNISADFVNLCVRDLTGVSEYLFLFEAHTDMTTTYCAYSSGTSTVSSKL